MRGRRLMAAAITGFAAGMSDRRRPGGPAGMAAVAALRSRSVGRDPRLRRALVAYLGVVLVVLAAFTAAAVLMP